LGGIVDHCRAGFSREPCEVLNRFWHAEEIGDDHGRHSLQWQAFESCPVELAGILDVHETDA
jgi:hypothetical protein